MTSSPLIRPGIFNTSTTAESPSSASPIIVESDFVVILAALLCALICVIGLVAVARCAWLRRNSTTNSRTGINSSSSSSQTVGGAANKGLKKKILRSLPKLSFNDSMKQKLIDCAICLTEFVNGDEIRVLPQCNHGFHVTCIDTWLGSHSSCPSCRQILVVSRCQKCGGFPANNSGADIESEIQMKAREDDVNRFLP